jgi:hypothetical protein
MLICEAAMLHFGFPGANELDGMFYLKAKHSEPWEPRHGVKTIRGQLTKAE